MSDNVKDFEQSKEKMADAARGRDKVGEQLDKARRKFTDAAGEVETEGQRIVGQGAARKSREALRKSRREGRCWRRERTGWPKEKVRYGYEKARKDMDHSR